MTAAGAVPSGCFPSAPQATGATASPSSPVPVAAAPAALPVCDCCQEAEGRIIDGCVYLCPSCVIDLGEQP